MFTVQDDWIEYEEVEHGRVQLTAVPARRTAVRGGGSCAQRIPVAAARPVAHRAGARPVARRAGGSPDVQRTGSDSGARPSAGRPVAHRAAPQPAPRLHLTRRGRVVLVVLPALLALSGALLAAGPGVAEAAPRQTARTVVVGTGDTLWTIAERVAPRTDPRETVAAIERANSLAGAGVQAGDRLVLPVGR